MVARKLWLLEMHFNSILNYIVVFSLRVNVSFFLNGKWPEGPGSYIKW
jgi:hypothetical protein